MGREARRDGARGGSRVLLRFTLSYFLLLLVPLALTVGAMVSAYRMAEEQVMDSNQLTLRHALEQIEGSIGEAERFTLTLGAVDAVVDALQQGTTATPEALFRIGLAVQRLPAFADSRGIITGYWLYAADGDFLLTRNKAYVNLWRYYANSLRYEGMDWATFRANVLSMQNVSGFLPESRHIHLSAAWQDAITMFRPFLSTSTTRQSGRLLGKAIYFLDVQRIGELLSPALSSDDTHAYVLDRDGRLLMALHSGGEGVDTALLPAPGTGGRVRLDGQDMVISQASGEGAGLRIVVLTPAAAVYSRVGALTRTLVIVMLALLALGVAFAYIVARQNRRPLAHMLPRLPQSGGAQGLSSLWDVDRAVHDLADRQLDLKARLEEQRAQMRAAFVHQLTSRGIQDELEMEALLRHLGLSIAGSVYRGVYMEIRGDIEVSENTLIQADFTQRVVLQALSAFQGRLLYLTMLDWSHYILLYSADAPENDTPALSGVFGELYRRLHLTHGLQPLLFLGQECAHITALHTSFAAALHLMESSERKGGQFLFVVTPGQGADHGYAYTARDEQRLVDLAEKGRLGDIRALLDHLYRQNFVQRQLDPFMRRLLEYRMLGTLALHAQSPAPPHDLEGTLGILTPREFFDALHARYAAWCDQSAQRIEASQHQLIQDVLGHMHAGFDNDAMGLAAVALHFGVTESYLSAFFKEKVGRTFSATLETIRIQHANDLLMTTQLTIDDIARRVGYTNADSFRRAYKRVQGYAPSQRRREGAD